MVIEGIKISNHLTVGTLRQARYHRWSTGTDMVEVNVGILPNNTNTLTRRRIQVPMKKLLNGQKPDSIRTARYSHLMNIIQAYASHLWSVDFEKESVIFLGFTLRQ